MNDGPPDPDRKGHGRYVLLPIIQDEPVRAPPALLFTIFAGDPTRPIGDDFLAQIPPYGPARRRMTRVTFRRARARLQELGILQGDKVSPAVLASRQQALNESIRADRRARQEGGKP